MHTSGSSHEEESWIENIGSMTSIWYAVVNDEAEEGLKWRQTIVLDILANSTLPSHVSRDSIRHGRAICACMTRLTSWPLHLDHVSGCVS
jgi:hypothetical protein